MEGERIVHLLSWHQVQTEAELGAALKQVKDADWLYFTAPKKAAHTSCTHEAKLLAKRT